MTQRQLAFAEARITPDCARRRHAREMCPRTKIISEARRAHHVALMRACSWDEDMRNEYANERATKERYADD